MQENDSHAPGSVDRALLAGMVRVCQHTADYLYSRYTPTKVVYRPGSRPDLEETIDPLVHPGIGEETLVEGIAHFCARLCDHASDNLDTMRIGGTEEQIIERGSDWCTDVARVGCILCQVAGVPARIVNLADTERPYSGHVIIEAYRSGTWGAVDTSINVLYRRPDGKPATTWELMNDPPLVEAHARPGAIYSRPGQFRAAAIVNYLVADSGRYDYTVSGVNAYYRSILEQSKQGWPGGLRWLHGEDSRGVSQE